jgi:hypothetical protein
MRRVSPRIFSRPSITEEEGVRLSLSFQASSLRQAVNIAAELRTLGADLARVRPSRLRLPGRPDWIVTLTTPPLPLTLAVIQLWEGEMLVVEQRWPGCHFFGWTTRETPCASIRSSQREGDHDGAHACRTLSQRELVRASLLRHPTGEPGELGHGRGQRR